MFGYSPSFPSLVKLYTDFGSIFLSFPLIISILAMMNEAVTGTDSQPNSSSSFVPCRIEFHKDDYTHPCHPLYVHPSNILGGSFMFIPFDGTCYAS